MVLSQTVLAALCHCVESRVRAHLSLNSTKAVLYNRQFPIFMKFNQIIAAISIDDSKKYNFPQLKATSLNQSKNPEIFSR